MTNSTKDDRRFYEDHCKVISERMNLFDFQKTRGTVKAPLYVPPTYLPPIPSCRKPLERMSEKSLTKHGSPVTDCEESDPLETSDEDVDSDNDTPDHSNESFENQRNRTRTLSRSPPRYGSTYKETCNMTSQRTRIYSGKENSNETSKKSHNISYVPKSAAASQSVPTFVNAKRCLLCVTIVVAVAIAMATRFETLAFPSQEVPVSGQNERKNTFLKDIKTIEKKFPNQEDYTWSAVQLGIEDIVLRSGRSMTSERPQKPWIFILYSNRPKELFCLAELLGKACSKALSSNNSLSLEPEEFGDEYGDTIFRLKPIIEERKAVVSFGSFSFLNRIQHTILRMLYTYISS